jgi:hypothetical protein
MKIHDSVLNCLFKRLSEEDTIKNIKELAISVATESKTSVERSFFNEFAAYRGLNNFKENIVKEPDEQTKKFFRDAFADTEEKPEKFFHIGQRFRNRCEDKFILSVCDLLDRRRKEARVALISLKDGRCLSSGNQEIGAIVEDVTKISKKEFVKITYQNSHNFTLITPDET